MELNAASTFRSKITMKTLSDTHVVLQAGGEGRRIRCIDANTPKPMLTVGGIPLIERLIRQLASAGFRKFTVVTGFEGAIIQDHIRVVMKSLPHDVDIHFYQEPHAMGNAGVVTKIVTSPSSVLLTFADLLTQIDFAKLVEIHGSRRSDVTLASHYEEHKLALGELTVDGDIVRKYAEKPTKRYLICSGIAVLEPNVLRAAKELPQPFGLSDLIQLAINRSYQVSHWTHESTWMDVNTPEALQEARALADKVSA